MFAPAPRQALAASTAPAEPVPPELGLHRQRQHVLRPGLGLHADDTVDRWDLTARGQVDSGLRILVVLEGSVDVSYGEQRLLMGGARTRGGSAVLVNLRQPEPFARRLRKGRHARRVSVSLSGAWLAEMTAGEAQDDAVGEFMRRHLAVHSFAPSPRLMALAGQLAAGREATAVLRHLYMESRALEFTAEALGALLPTAADAPLAQTLGPREIRRMRELHEFLRSDAALGLSLQGIARQIGMHPNTMQRHFRAQYGTTVVDCVREARLQRARQALESEGLSVSQAAEIAGYTTAANFATAFRRRFGMPPKWARAR